MLPNSPLQLLGVQHAGVDNRRLVGKYLEFFQFPDGRVEIRVAGQSLPYSAYNKLGTYATVVVDNKRLRQNA